MLQTPVRSLRSILVSDFEDTHNIDKSRTLEKQANQFAFDRQSTPKKSLIFLPLQDRVLRKHEFKNIRNNRAKMIDWYLQIAGTYGLGWECFWMTVELFDSLIADFDYICINNVHLAGMVCVFITAKLMGKSNLKLKHVMIGLGHNKFSQSDIINQEENILSWIFQYSNFERNNIYTYMMEKYYDFPENVLCDAMKMLTLAMMRPDMSVDAMRVTTYKELIDRVMLDVSTGRTVIVLELIKEEMREKYGSVNIQNSAPRIKL